MLRSRYVRRTFYIDIPDEQAIEAIMQRYGVSTHSDAVRLALRLTAQSPVAVLPKRKGKPS